MRSRIQHEITEIKDRLLQMSSMSEEAVRTAIQASQRQDSELAKRVMEQDWEIDYAEVEIHGLILRTLALQQPMAVDLRFLAAALQITSQLERAGDHAVNIAEQVINLTEKSNIIAVASPNLTDMARQALKMLADAINSFVYNDADLAYRVISQDKEVDDLYTKVLSEEIKTMEKDVSEVRPGVYHIILAINIERIADLATNIAEDVVFLVEGRLIRHEEGKEKPVAVAPHAEAKEPAEGELRPCPERPVSGRREPLECLENHARHVHDCLEKTMLAVKAYMEGRKEDFERYANEVTELEHAADMIKRNVRAHLPKGIIMPIDKFELFLYLNEQDAIAGSAEDLLEWLTYRSPLFSEDLRVRIEKLMLKCVSLVEELPRIINGARTYFETGDEETRVWIKDKIRDLRIEEHDADIMEHQLKRKVFSKDEDPVTVFYMVRLVELIGSTADHAESAVDILRSMIAK